MNPLSSEKIAELLKCIAHPVKLDIIKLLSVHEQLTVSEIHVFLGCDCEQSMLSHHLIKMKDKGVLRSEKSGKYIHYQLAKQTFKTLINVLENFN